MAAFASLTPGNGLVVLSAVSGENPERQDGEWTQSQLALRCAEMCGKDCSSNLVGVTLKQTLEPKGLVTSRKESRQVLLWAPTAEARALAS